LVDAFAIAGLMKLKKMYDAESYFVIVIMV